MAELDRVVEKAGDWIGRQVDKLPWAVAIGGILWGQNQNPGTPAREGTDAFLNWFTRQSFRVRQGIVQDWDLLKRSLRRLGLETIIAAAVALLIGLLTGNRLFKGFTELAIAAYIVLRYSQVYVRNYKGILKACAAAGFIKGGKRIMIHLRAIDEAARDFGVTKDGNLDALLKSAKTAFDECGTALQDGADIFRDVGIVTFQKPMRVVTWFVAGALYIVLVNLHRYPLLWLVGVLGLLILLPGILAWSKGQREQEQVPRRLLRIAGWILIFPIVAISFIPEVATWILNIQYVYMGPAAEALRTKLLWHNTIHLWMAVTLVLVYSFLEFSIFPTVGDGSIKNKVRGVAGILMAFVLVSFFALGALVQMHGAFANAYEAGSWRTRGYLVGLAVAVIVLATKAFHGKWKAALVVVAVLFVGSCFYQRGNGHRGLWGGQFDYEAYARAQAKQAQAVAAPVEPAPTNSLMLPAWGPPPGWTPPDADGKKSETTQSSVSVLPSVAQASVIPPMAKSLPDTIRQVLSPGTKAWKLWLEPGEYLVWYSGTLYYDRVPSVTVIRDGRAVKMPYIVDEKGGSVEAAELFRPQDFPMPDRGVGDPFFRVHGGQACPIPGTREARVRVDKATQAEIGSNITDEPFWKGTGSLLVYFVKVS